MDAAVVERMDREGNIAVVCENLVNNRCIALPCAAIMPVEFPRHKPGNLLLHAALRCTAVNHISIKEQGMVSRIDHVVGLSILPKDADHFFMGAVIASGDSVEELW